MFIGPVDESKVLALLNHEREVWWMDHESMGRVTLPREMELPIRHDMVFVVDYNNVLRVSAEDSQLL